MDHASMKNSRKNALSRHDAVAHLLEDCAAVMAFLADLRHLKNYIVASKFRSHRKFGKIKTFDYQVFSKSTVFDLGTFCAEFLDRKSVV